MKLISNARWILLSFVLIAASCVLADEPATAPKPGAAPTPPAPPAASKPEKEVIAWDADNKEVMAKAGDAEAHFTFNLTNVSPNDVVITSVATSCGCTTAQLPPMPWKLISGTNGEIHVTMNLAGKSGTVGKTVTVNFSDKPPKTLIVKTTITPAEAAK